VTDAAVKEGAENERAVKEGAAKEAADLPAADLPAAEMERARVKARIAEAVEDARVEILELSHRIHANPEPAFEEHRAAAWVADAVRRHGYAVEHPAGRLPTAVRGTLSGGRGSSGARVGVLAEYDALPGLGHGCGHNTMAASGVGAAIALAAVAPEWSGQVVFLGTPAEERGSGKQFMLDDGLFDGLDAALLFHPCDRTHVESRALASVDVDVTFTGLQAHAAADPWMGRNALDALVMLFNSIGLWRQQLKPEARVHGIVVEGGTAANIIPSRTAGRFMLRATDASYFEELQQRFRDMVEAAALASGCRGEAIFSGASLPIKHNAVIASAYRANLEARGLVDAGLDPGMGSTDMGNVSQVVPAIHPDIAITEEGTAGHSTDFRDAALTPRADEATLHAATLIAQTAYDLLDDPELVAAAWREFRGA
jgi:amidohydrolase